MEAKHAELAPSAKLEQQAFYTGKPYIELTDSYTFKYRSYNPELARWTSEDPSGFPDGANGNIYAPTPTHEFDFMGLSTQTIDGGSSVLPPNTAWEMSSYIQDNNQGVYYQFRAQQQYLSWETAATRIINGSYGNSITATASMSLTQTETWGWNANGAFQIGTDNVKFTIGGGYQEAYSTGNTLTFGGSETKAGQAGVAWSADLLIAKTQLFRQVAYFELINGEYKPHSSNASLARWHGDTIVSSGYASSAGFKWTGAVE